MKPFACIRYFTQMPSHLRKDTVVVPYVRLKLSSDVRFDCQEPLSGAKRRTRIGYFTHWVSDLQNDMDVVRGLRLKVSAVTVSLFCQITCIGIATHGLVNFVELRGGDD